MIHKAAGIIIKDQRLLVERTRGKDIFFAPGGKLQENETPQQALVRELHEECGITVKEADLRPFGSWTAEAAGQPGQQVQMEVFMVQLWQGEPQASAEIEEIAWITSSVPADMQLGSIFAHEVVPRLKEKGLIA